MSYFQQQPLVFLLALSNSESLLRICKLCLSLLPQLVSILLPDHDIIQIFQLGREVVLDSSIGSIGSLQCLGQLGLISS
jgi:hypothetical protein